MFHKMAAELIARAERKLSLAEEVRTNGDIRQCLDSARQVKRDLAKAAQYIDFYIDSCDAKCLYMEANADGYLCKNKYRQSRCVLDECGKACECPYFVNRETFS